MTQVPANHIETSPYINGDNNNNNNNNNKNNNNKLRLFVTK